MIDSHKTTKKAIETVWQIESARLIGGLVRLVRDVGLAEDLAQEALVAALEHWPVSGIPDNPGAWLMRTAKNRGVDYLRHREMRGRKHDELAELTPKHHGSNAMEAAIDEAVGDDLLRLMLIACHPVLSKQARAALTLRLLGGLSTQEIARAFLTPEPTIAQRIVRAKRTLSDAQVPFEVPRGTELSARVSSVLEVIYLIFNEGYSASRGEHWMRPQLCEDALRLGRILAELVPSESEVHGLVALMEIQASRMRARTDAQGQQVLLLDQDRSRWDQLLIQRGFTALLRAEATGQSLGPYTLQAAIAACHARAKQADDTDWEQIVALYSLLVQLTESPVVELNRAVAVSMADGPLEALKLVDALAEAPELASYYLLPTVRGDLLHKLKRFQEAKQEFERAAQLTDNLAQKQVLLARARSCVD